MLVLARREDERIRIGENVILRVVEIRGNVVRLGFDAPPDVAIHREEVWEQIRAKSAGKARDEEED